MKLDRLYGMHDFVRRVKESYSAHELEHLTFIFNHEELLSSPLEYWMITPCDKEGNRLKEPDGFGFWWMDKEKEKYPNNAECQAYLEGKRRMLFVVPVHVQNIDELVRECFDVARLADVFRETTVTTAYAVRIGLPATNQT